MTMSLAEERRDEIGRTLEGVGLMTLIRAAVAATVAEPAEMTMRTSKMKIPKTSQTPSMFDGIPLARGSQSGPPTVD